MSGGDVEDVTMEEESSIPQEVRYPEEVADSVTPPGNILKCVRLIRAARERALAVIANSKMSKQVKEDIEKEWEQIHETVEILASDTLHHPEIPEGLMKEVRDTLTQRGIDSVEDWKELKETIKAKCSKETSRELQEMIPGKPNKQETGIQTISSTCQDALFQEGSCQTGPRFVHSWKKHGTGPQPTTSAQEDQGAAANIQLVNYLRAMTCADPGVYKGSKGENFQEFLRKFKRKYENVIHCEETLVEILADDHLAGRAKNVFSSLPPIVRKRSMISIIPIRLLARAQQRGYDVDSLRVVPESELKPVFDASNNRMYFKGAAYIEVEIEKGQRETIAFHLSAEKDAETIIGTNALSKLGIEVFVNGEKSEDKKAKMKENKKNKVVVTKRLYIPPSNTALVQVKCEDDTKSLTERVIWPSERGVEPGVYTVENQNTTIPVFNNSTEPLLLKKGQNVGHWETDKWHEQWEDLNPLLADRADNELSETERLQKLEELLAANTESQVLDEEVRDLIRQYPDTFSISDRELTQTDLVKMTIDTGDCAPIRMKARPVPLGLRSKLKELLADLLERKVIEHSKSEWAFPIVLVEKKDGSIR
ncbi:hypothetical protein OSTOST_17153, partial [Ostertagia ostertagi]